MNKSVADLAAQKIENMPFEVVADVEPSGTGFARVNAYKFKSKDVIIVNIHQSGVNYMLNFFDEQNKYTTAVIVPPTFMLKAADNEKAQALIKKYRMSQLDNLHTSLYFGTGKIGSDPEIFVENSKGTIIPAFNFLGSKAKPDHTPGYGENYHTVLPRNKTNGNDLYWDGFQAEFTTRASHCMGWHADSIQAGLRGIYLAAKKFNKNARLSIKTVFDISPELLAKSKPEHVAFGCNASFNAYGMNGLQAPGNTIGYRSAGGHVHFGFDKKHSKEVYEKMVKALDAILGVAGVSMFATYDDPRRRIMYGLAGEYRLPPHGLEYRVLSNAWLFHPVLANIVFDLARSAAMFGMKDMISFWDAKEEETINVINTCNVEGARAILKRNETLMKKIINVKYSCNEMADYAYKAILNGAESIIKDPSDIVGNWNLDIEWTTHCDGTNKTVQRVAKNKKV